MAPVERIGVGVFTQALREALYGGECDMLTSPWVVTMCSSDSKPLTFSQSRTWPDCVVASLRRCAQTSTFSRCVWLKFGTSELGFSD